ncbi:hypothetical protein ACXX9E_29310 [Pseudomonas sp. GNP014]
MVDVGVTLVLLIFHDMDNRLLTSANNDLLFSGFRCLVLNILLVVFLKTPHPDSAVHARAGRHAVVLRFLRGQRHRRALGDLVIVSITIVIPCQRIAC